MEDKTIISLFFDRSNRAVEELANKYGSICTHTARNILGNHQDAEECVNDAYMGVWNAIPPKKPDSLAAFVLRLVHNTCKDRLRYNLAAKRSGNYQDCLEEWNGCLSHRDTPEAVYEKRLVACYIDEFITNLNRTNRLLFVRRYWYMDSVSTLARLTGMTPGAVSTRLSRLRDQLKAELAEKGVFV